MENKTDYTPEIKQLLESYYAPISAAEYATETTIYKTLSTIHEDITNILPSKWVYQEDVYKVLAELGFKALPKMDEDGHTTFLYYLEPK